MQYRQSETLRSGVYAPFFLLFRTLQPLDPSWTGESRRMSSTLTVFSLEPDGCFPPPWALMLQDEISDLKSTTKRQIERIIKRSSRENLE